MRFSDSVKQKKTRLFLYTDLTYFYQGNKTHIHTVLLYNQSSMQLEQKESGTNIYTSKRALVNYYELDLAITYTK